MITGNVYQVAPAGAVSFYVDRAALIVGAGSIKGISVTVDTEPGNTYVRNASNDKWIVKSNNIYGVIGDVPLPDTNFEVPQSTKINLADNSEYVINGTGDAWELVPVGGGGSLTITEQATIPTFDSMSEGDMVLSNDDTLSIKSAAGGYRIDAPYTADPI